MVEIDVVILNWNGINFLKQFLPVLIEHTPEEKARIIVADNGSCDDSLNWLAANFATRVSVISFDVNHGFAGGYNLALDQTKGKYAVLLNSDVAVTEGWLDPLYEAIQDENVVAVMPRIRSFSSPEKFEYAGAAGGFIDRWGFPFCRGRVLDHIETDNDQYSDTRNVFWATGACMMVKTKVFREVGGLDVDFFAHMEEIDLCWRLKALGYSILAVPASVVFHLGGGTLPSGNHRKVFLNVRNSLFMLYKNLPAKNMLSILFVRMILDGIAALKFLLEGKSRNFTAVMKAHLAFYKGRKNYRLRKNQNKDLIHPKHFSGYYPGSIVLDYYLRRKRNFSQIESKVVK